jgi:hypothetical protein
MPAGAFSGSAGTCAKTAAPSSSVAAVVTELLMSVDPSVPCRICFYGRIGLALALGALLIVWLVG